MNERVLDIHVLLDSDHNIYKSIINECTYIGLDSILESDFNHLRVFHINANRLTVDGRLELLEQKIVDYYDVICISETWLKDENFMLYNLNGFKHYAVCRAKSKGGGVSVFIREQFSSHEVQISTNSDESVQVLGISILRRGIRANIVTVYPNHRSRLNEMISHLEIVLHKLPSLIFTIITGDLNIDLTSNRNDTSQLISAMASWGFIPTISLPTRFASNSCIDHF